MGWGTSFGIMGWGGPVASPLLSGLFTTSTWVSQSDSREGRRGMNRHVHLLPLGQARSLQTAGPRRQ